MLQLIHLHTAFISCLSSPPAVTASFCSRSLSVKTGFFLPTVAKCLLMEDCLIVGGFLCIIVVSLPYSTKSPDVTVVTWQRIK